MTREEIKDVIREILVESFHASGPIDDATTFRGDLLLDSLDIVEFITSLQKRFKFRASMDSYREVDTIRKLVDFIDDTLQGR